MAATECKDSTAVRTAFSRTRRSSTQAVPLAGTIPFTGALWWLHMLLPPAPTSRDLFKRTKRVTCWCEATQQAQKVETQPLLTKCTDATPSAPPRQSPTDGVADLLGNQTSVEGIPPPDNWGPSDTRTTNRHSLYNREWQRGIAGQTGKKPLLLVQWTLLW
jgi:hypothetical protein